MPDDEELLVGSEDSLPEGDEPLEETEEQDPTKVLEERIAALEQAQRQSVLEIRSAVGRVQSLAAKLDKTNDPQVEAKLRTELAGVSELLGLVTDSIDETILPRDVKQKVAQAQATARAAAADAEINRRIQEAIAPVATRNATPDADNIEAAVVSQIRALGLDDTDPAFNWDEAARLLHTQGQAAMWGYFSQIEQQLLASKVPEGGPQRRPRTAAPRAAAASTPQDLTTQLEAAEGNLDKQVAILRSMGITV